MSLDDYRRKRDFAKTPEPAPAARPGSASGRRFVIHRHEARAVHYDLRLEHGGALCSWAVPRGFSFDPKDKRLAVRTEDHPIEYLEFTGVIPRGQYGAGTMLIWDRGTFDLVVENDWDTAVAKGELKFVLRGRKLRGEWHMVKTKQAPNSWLLFKSGDRYAGPPRDTVLGVPLDAAIAADLPRAVTVARADAVSAPFSAPDWLFEMKFLGRRILAEKRGDAVRLRGMRKEVPPVLDGLRRLVATDALLDGVLVATDEAGRPSREELERRLRAGAVEELQYYAFDLLHFDEFDTRPMPQLWRKGALRAVLAEPSAVLFVDHVTGSGESLVEAVTQAGLPGVIAKRAHAAYGQPGAWCEVPVAGDAPDADVATALNASRRARRPGRVRFSNLEKVYWPAEGYTKGDLIRHYEQVADLLLPYLMDRPVHMLRYPDGIEGKSFYQRQAPEGLPEWFPTETVVSRSSDETHRHMVCTSRDAILWLVNMGSIDLHPWMSRVGSLESPDYVVIDLDPGSAPFRDVVRVARVVGRILRGIGAQPALKTSGKSGLHIHVALRRGYSYEQGRMFAEGVARAVCRELPEIATVERNVGSRGSRVYLDFMQNRTGQTVVPPYVVRPVRGAQVSAPLAWDELELAIEPSQFTIQTLPERLARHGDLFRPSLDTGLDLLDAVNALQELLRS